MADRVSASIVIGGKVTPAQFEDLCQRIAQNDLRMDWDGEPFARAPSRRKKMRPENIRHK